MNARTQRYASTIIMVRFGETVESAMRGECTIFLRICKSSRAVFSRR
jgi:hypothetical protein